MTRLHPARWPAFPVLVVAWASYVAFLVAAFPTTPLAVLSMVVPLLLVGWYARNQAVTATVGLGHGAALAGIGWWIGAFASWPGGNAGLALVAALLMLLSWFTAVAGHTVRIMQQLRSRTHELQHARLEMDADRASVEAIYEASAAGLIALAHDGTIRSWNLGARKIFGYHPRDILGAEIQRLAAVGDPDDCTARVRYALAHQQGIDTIDARMRHADGHPLDVEVRGQPMTHPDGDPGFILTIVDRTRERQMERELRMQAALQDRMLQNLEDVIYSVEVPSKQVLLVTRNIEKLIGKDADEITNYDQILDLAHPDDREEVEKRWEHVRAGEQNTLRWRIRGADGSHAWVEDHAVPARDEDGRVVRVDSIVRRVGRDIELERQAQRMMRWLDSMEPMTGGGAWSVDLRDGSWSWSSGMHRILGTKPSEEDLEALCSRMQERSAERLRRLVADPSQLPGPVRIHIHDGTQPRPFMLESWMQRGADGEPIWLYGIIQPLHRRKATGKGAPSTTPRDAPATKKARPEKAEAEEAPTDAGSVTVQVAAPDDHVRIAEALQRSREAVEAARLAAAPFAPTGWDRHAAVASLGVAVCDAIVEQITNDIAAASQWAEHRRVRLATGMKIHLEPVEETAQAWGEDTVRALRDAILASERQALEQSSKQALAAAEATKRAALEDAERVKQEALAAARQAQQDAMAQVARAQQEATASAAQARQAKEARQRAEEAQARAEALRAQAMHEAEAARAEALKQVKQARAEALREAEGARARAEQEALRAKEAEDARARAEAARATALQEAEEAKLKSQKEAGQARAEALEQAKHAKERAEAIAAEAARAKRLRDEAEQAKAAAVEAARLAQERAVREAEEAKAKVLQEAEAATSRVLEQARRAEAAAKQEAAKARAAEEARAKAEQAAKEAKEAAEQAAKQARREAEAATQKAIAEAEAARDAALEEARRATAEALAQAEQARMEAIQAAKQAQEAAREEQAKSRRAEEAMARAVQDAEHAKAEALALAEQAQAEARAEAREAIAARDAALAAADEARQRFEEAERKAEVELEALRRRVDHEPFRVTSPSFQPVPTGKSAMPEEEVEMEVAWDDEVGWVPRPKKKDTAEELKAKSWSDDQPSKVKGPWALD